MAKSSINFQQAHGGGLRHNDRTAPPPDYLLPEKFWLGNDVDRSAADAARLLSNLYAEARENYQENFGQKLQAKSYLWEAVVNLNKEHTLEDVKRLVKAIEKETGFTGIQSAIHRDEGRMERGVPIYNFHAHLTFFTLDKSTGKQLYRKDITPSERKELVEEIRARDPMIEDDDLKKEVKRLKGERYRVMDRARLSKLQDITAEILNMQRGKVGSKAVRKGHKQYRDQKQQEAAVMAKLKDIDAENRRLRQQLKEMGAKRADYAKLEAEIREMREQAREKDLTLSDLQTRIAKLEQELAERDQLVAKIEELAAVAGVVEEVPEEQERATREEIIDATKFLVHSNLKIDAEWKGNSSLKSLNEMSDYIKFCDDYLDRENLDDGSLLAIYDSYLVHQDERPKTRPKVELLAQKGAFSQFYSRIKEKTRILELVEAMIRKFTGEPSTPSPVVPTSKIRQSQPRSRGWLKR